MKKEESKVVYDCDDFKIYTIPLNYQIEYKIKVENSKGKMVKLIPQYQYWDINDTLENAIATAKHSIERYMNEYKTNPYAKKLL